MGRDILIANSWRRGCFNLFRLGTSGQALEVWSSHARVLECQILSKSWSSEQCYLFMQALGHSHRAFGTAAQRAQHYAAAATKECYLKGQGDDSHVESKSPMGILKLSFGKQCHFIKNSQQRGICDISGGLTMSLAKKMECSQSAIFLVYGHWWILFRRTIIGLVPCPQLTLVLKRRFPHPDSHWFSFFLFM